MRADPQEALASAGRPATSSADDDSALEPRPWWDEDRAAAWVAAVQTLASDPARHEAEAWHGSVDLPEGFA